MNLVSQPSSQTSHCARWNAPVRRGEAGHWPRWIALIPLLFLGLNPARTAQAADPHTIHSRSGQFIVRGYSLLGAPLPLNQNADVLFLDVDPALLAVSCEQIKTALLRQLDMEDSWKANVLLTVRPVKQNDEPVLVKSLRFADRWQYHVSLPERVETKRLINALVKVLLLERAQRKTRSGPVELPLWLGEGMAELVEKHSLDTLALQPNSRILKVHDNKDPLQSVRQRLQANPPLTLEELTWPSPRQFSGDHQAIYQGCSHLLVHELLQLKEGPECLQNMLQIMPDYLNWQTAFLRAFARHFPTMLDFNKWWSLVLVQNAGRDLTYTWSNEVSWERFENILLTPIQVRLASRDLPMNTKASLQSIIQEWAFRKQLPILTAKLNHLHALRMRVSQDLIQLVDDYRQTLSRYLERRGRPRVKFSRKDTGTPNFTLLVNATLQRLNDLDQRRARLKALSFPTSSPPPKAGNR